MAKLISARPIAEGVWQLTDPFENRAYVVAGRERALLVDAMAGFWRRGGAGVGACRAACRSRWSSRTATATTWRLLCAQRC